jgi:hypothetical protein
MGKVQKIIIEIVQEHGGEISYEDLTREIVSRKNTSKEVALITISSFIKDGFLIHDLLENTLLLSDKTKQLLNGKYVKENKKEGSKERRERLGIVNRAVFKIFYRENFNEIHRTTLCKRVVDICKNTYFSSSTCLSNMIKNGMLVYTSKKKVKVHPEWQEKIIENQRAVRGGK